LRCISDQGFSGARRACGKQILGFSSRRIIFEQFLEIFYHTVEVRTNLSTASTATPIAVTISDMVGVLWPRGPAGFN
jgi:hypothetical protein